jgi:hypothetical protein
VLDLWGQSESSTRFAPYTWLSELPNTRENRGADRQRFRKTRVPAVDQWSTGSGADAERNSPLQQDLIIGAQPASVAGAGPVRFRKIVNIGTNRWSFNRRFGISKAVGP